MLRAICFDPSEYITQWEAALLAIFFALSEVLDDCYFFKSVTVS